MINKFVPVGLSFAKGNGGVADQITVLEQVMKARLSFALILMGDWCDSGYRVDLVSIFKTRQQLVLDNLALRQQLAVLNRSVKRPSFTCRDRIFWVWLSRFWSHWVESLLIVQPQTVVRWHRQGFRWYWAWKPRKAR